MLYSQVFSYKFIFFSYSFVMVYHGILNTVLCRVGPCCLSILYIIVCTCWPQTPSPSLLHAPAPRATTILFSLPVNLLLFCRWLHLCHILDSTSIEVAQSCPTLCDPMDCSLPRSSVDGIFQARVLEWGAISFSRGSFWPRDQTQVLRTVGRRFTVQATREVLIPHKHDIKWYLSFSFCPPSLSDNL